MITKTPLENKHFGNGDYFVIIASSSRPLLLTEHAANGLVEAHVVIWQTTSKNCTKVRAARAARLLFLIQPIRSLFTGVIGAVAVHLA